MKWIWAAWLLAIVVSFSALEAYALIDNTTTLSRWVWTITAAFPLFPWLAGCLTGGLAVHFWWGGIVPFAPVKKDG